MKNFSYKRTINAEEILIDKPKKKINKQQRIFVTFFVLLFGTLGWYFTKDLFIATFDGNIVSFHEETYLMDDVFLLDVKVKPGDIVSAGDTMLYFLYTHMLYSAMNPIGFSDYEQKLLTFNIAKGENLLELKAIKKQERALQLLINKVNHNISLGLNTTKDLASYSIELERVKQQLDYTQNIVNLYANSIRTLNYTQNQHLPQILDPFKNTNDYLIENLDKFGDMLQYLVAPEKTLILAINKYPSNIVFKQDPIMLIYPIEEGSKRIHIEMIVKPRFLNEMNDGEAVEIYFGTRYMGDGTIKINNTYMKNVNSVKLGKFSTDQEGAIIRINIDNPEELSLKYQVSGLPVKLNYRRNWHFFNKND